jgi:hypothetical protein
MNDELESIWKKAVMILLEYNTDIYLEDLRRSLVTPRQYVRCPDRDE